MCTNRASCNTQAPAPATAGPDTVRDIRAVPADPPEMEMVVTATGEVLHVLQCLDG